MRHAILQHFPRLGAIRTQLDPIIGIESTALERPALHAPDISLVQVPAQLPDLLLREADLRAPFQERVAVFFAAFDVGCFVLVVVKVQVFEHRRLVEALEDGVCPILPSRPVRVGAVDLGELFVVTGWGWGRGVGLIGRGVGFRAVSHWGCNDCGG